MCDITFTKERQVLQMFRTSEKTYRCMIMTILCDVYDNQGNNKGTKIKVNFVYPDHFILKSHSIYVIDEDLGFSIDNFTPSIIHEQDDGRYIIVDNFNEEYVICYEHYNFKDAGQDII